MLIRMSKDVYAYRELLFALVYRDLRVRYKQAVLGVAWVIFMPALAIGSGIVMRVAMALYSGREPQLSDMVGVMVKTVPWLMFASIVGQCASSLVMNMGLITKIYFPREVVPLSVAAAKLFDIGISLVALVAALALLQLIWPQQAGVVLSAHLALLPLLLLVLVMLAVGLGLGLGAANVFLRDVRYVVTVLLQFGVFFSLVYFTYEEMGQWGWLFLFNPVAPPLEAIGQIVTRGGVQPYLWPWLGYSTAAAVAALAIGTAVFRRSESLFAEYA
jgi:ABC-type polysaccharide/polyol phosphate export permease